MCLKKVSSYSNSRYFSLSGLSRMEVSFPCGECAECKQMKRTEYFVRNYYQCRSTIDQGGFVLYDTLSFDPDHVPSWNSVYPEWALPDDQDFYCFDRRLFKEFMDRVRSRLRREGYDVKDNVKYFYASEYGDRDWWPDKRGILHRGTHRPHYHVLFYVTDSTIDPLYFSQVVCDEWIYGMTDGIQYKTVAYVMHNVFNAQTCDLARTQAVCGYLCKYITKDSDYGAKIEKVSKTIVERILAMGMINPLVAGAEKDFEAAYSDREWFKLNGSRRRQMRDRYVRRKVRHHVEKYALQHHGNSQGFGLAALDDRYLDRDKLENEGVLFLPDTDNVRRKVPVPLYLLRKQYYEQRVRDDGTREWVPNKEGRKWLRCLYKRRVENIVDSNHVFYMNATPEQRSYIDDILNGRTWWDFARYQVYYKGRVYDPNKPLPRWREILRSDLYKVYPDSFELVDESDVHVIGENVDVCWLESVRKGIPFYCRHVFDRFDELYGYMSWIREFQLNPEKQKVFDRKECLEKLYRKMDLHLPSKTNLFK